MKTIADLIASIESRYPSVPGIWAPICQTGDVYLMLGDQGATAPDTPPGTYKSGAHILYDSPAEAILGGAACFDAYARWWHEQNPEAKPVLYWRYERKMLMSETQHRRHRRYHVQGRLVLSAKPVIYADRAAACRAIGFGGVAA